MSALTVYAYRDSSGLQRILDETDFPYTGTWSSTRAYNPLDGVTYGNTDYICTVATTGTYPTNTQAVRWSPLVVIRTGTGATEPNPGYQNLAWAGTVSFDMTGESYQSATVNGNTVIRVINQSPPTSTVVQEITTRVVSDGSNAYTLAWGSHTYFGTTPPTTLPAGQSVLAEFISYGSTAASLHALIFRQA